MSLRWAWYVASDPQGAAQKRKTPFSI